MLRYILKRCIMLIPIVICVSLLVFVLLNLTPGTALNVVGEGYSEEQLAELAHELGYDKPLIYRYLDYILDLLHGDFGQSVIYKESVAALYFERLPTTLILALLSMVIAVALSIPLGIIAATHHGSVVDNVSMVLALLGQSMPVFWLGLMLMVVFSQELGWLPSSGNMYGIRSYILPAISVGTGLMASLTRTTRSSMLDVINSDYLRTARAKGVSERTVIYRHALKNAMIPILTVIGVKVGFVLGGTVVTENVFSLQGVGRLIIDSVKQRDTITVTGCVIMTTILITLTQLVIDIIYAFVDPRLRAQYATKRGAKA